MELLLRRAVKGDADAFCELCAPYEGMVYRHCLQMLRNVTDAEDAAQDTMIRAYRSIGRFRGDSSVATWLYRIAHNICLDFLKRPQAKAASASLETLRDEGFEPADAQPTPESRYLSQSEAERLWTFVAELPDDQQALLSLRYGDNRSYDELAELFNVSLGTIKSRISRAKDRLRERMAKESS